VVSAKQFHDEHSGQGGNSSEVTFSQLGITTAEATLVKIPHPPANVTRATTEIPGDVVLIKDANTIIFSVCNVYFVAELVSAPNSETTTARSNSASNSEVSVEPWETLVRDTVTVNARQAPEYKFQLESETELMALFQVQGGLNDRIRVLLLDAANNQLFKSGSQFTTYPGTTGFVSGIGKYTFKVPHDDVYHLVLDNGKAWVLPRGITLHVDAALPHSTPDSERIQKVFEQLYSQLKQTFIFPGFQTSVRHCGVVNAFSTPNITLCVELVEELEAKGMTPAITFVYLHELGHSLMREWGLPLWDNEDAADEFATAMLLMAKQQELALQAAQWWASEGATTQDAIAKIWMDDRHSLSPQRARNIIRWVNNANEIVPRWQRVFVPNMQMQALESMLQDPAVLNKDFITSELSRRGVSR
jgi:hypothetical protein